MTEEHFSSECNHEENIEHLSHHLLTPKRGACLTSILRNLVARGVNTHYAVHFPQVSNE